MRFGLASSNNPQTADLTRAVWLPLLCWVVEGVSGFRGGHVHVGTSREGPETWNETVARIAAIRSGTEATFPGRRPTCNSPGSILTAGPPCTRRSRRTTSVRSRRGDSRLSWPPISQPLRQRARPSASPLGQLLGQLLSHRLHKAMRTLSRKGSRLICGSSALRPRSTGRSPRSRPDSGALLMCVPVPPRNTATPLRGTACAVTGHRD